MRDDQLGPDLRVVVLSTAGEVNGHPPVLALARVVQRADPADSSVFLGDKRRWWLSVYWGGPEPLPQMYAAEEILGVPAFGLVAASEPVPVGPKVAWPDLVRGLAGPQTGEGRSLPPFPVDDATLDLVEAALNPRAHGDLAAESSSMESLLELLSQMGGSDTNAATEETDEYRVLRDPQYHVHNVVEALVGEVRRLRRAAGGSE